MQTPPGGLLILPAGVCIWVVAFSNTSLLAPWAPGLSLFVTHSCVSLHCIYSLLISACQYVCILWNMPSLSSSIITLWHSLLLLNNVLHLANTKDSQIHSCEHSQWLACSLACFPPDIQLHTVTSQMDWTPSFIPSILARPPPPPHLPPRSILTFLPLWKMTPAVLPAW